MTASFSIPSLDHSYCHGNITESIQCYKTSCGCDKKDNKLSEPPEKGQEKVDCRFSSSQSV